MHKWYMSNYNWIENKIVYHLNLIFSFKEQKTKKNLKKQKRKVYISEKGV